MNERIRELEAQCWEHDQSWTGVGQRIFNREKFAALIVRDVLVICDAVSEPFEDPEMDKNIPGALMVAEMIRENFGVV